MAVKVFILGRPGSGKTTASHLITELVKCKGWSVTRIREYEILRSMFAVDIEHKRFRPTKYNGFDVIDFSVLDEALVEVEKEVREHMLSAKKKEFIIVELARDDYCETLKPMDPEFLHDTYILFVDADIDTCIQRIHQRISCSAKVDNHFVSDEILRSYYYKDNMQYVASHLKTDYGIEKIVLGIDNTGSLHAFAEQVIQFIEDIFRLEVTTQVPPGDREGTSSEDSSESIKHGMVLPLSLSGVGFTLPGDMSSY